MKDYKICKFEFFALNYANFVTINIFQTKLCLYMKENFLLSTVKEKEKNEQI